MHAVGCCTWFGFGPFHREFCDQPVGAAAQGNGESGCAPHGVANCVGDRGQRGVAIQRLSASEIEIPFVNACRLQHGRKARKHRARNLDAAKKFYDWALGPDAQRLGFEVGKQLQMPSAKAAPLPPGAPDLTKMKLVNYDFVKYGQAAERRRLLQRWDQEIGSIPR